ncbi:primosomal replication protein N [Neisseriaceae bacterium PsAf]|nr:primosomal replication protein N [Neisseriaceae bacterium PsAf]
MEIIINQFELLAEIVKVIDFKMSLAGKPILTLLLSHTSEQVEDGQLRQVTLNIVAKIIGNDALIYKDKINQKILAKGFLKTPKLGFKNVVFHINEITEFNHKGI